MNIEMCRKCGFDHRPFASFASAVRSNRCAWHLGESSKNSNQGRDAPESVHLERG